MHVSCRISGNNNNDDDDDEEEEEEDDKEDLYNTHLPYLHTEHADLCSL